jgi:colanic acid/amylovoran biosynthesis glycosyltransferase
LFISNYNYKNLVRFGVKTEKLVFHPVGIEIDKFPFNRKGRNNLPFPIVILTVARLVEEKGLKYSITAIKEILMKNSDLRLKYYIVGEGVLRESLINLVKKLKLGDIIKFLGPMDQLQVAKEMSMAHIFLLPSISEALPVVLMEAQAIGLPIIATDVGSVAEAIVDSRSGFLVPSRDVNALVEKIEYLVEHSELWPKMGRYGRKFIEENYNIRKLNQKLLKTYQNIIKGKRD